MTEHKSQVKANDQPGETKPEPVDSKDRPSRAGAAAGRRPLLHLKDHEAKPGAIRVEIEAIRRQGDRT